MTQQEKVTEHVSRMIMTLGVKSVRMDDVATSLGMSKRTLYEMFGDKEELLYQSVVYAMVKRHKELFAQVKQCDNMLEMLFESLRIFTYGGHIDEMEKRLAFNFKKFYPNVFERLQRFQSEEGLAGLQYALDQCVKDGYIDPVVDVELMARLFFSSTAIFMYDMNVSLPEDVTREEAFGAMVINFLRGLATVKGLKLIDELLAREPRPKTLKQRREEREQREGSLSENN